MGAELSKVNQWKGEMHSLEEVLYEDGKANYTLTINLTSDYLNDNGLTSLEKRELDVDFLSTMLIDVVGNIRDHTAEQIISKLDANYDDMLPNK